MNKKNGKKVFIFSRQRRVSLWLISFLIVLSLISINVVLAAEEKESPTIGGGYSPVPAGLTPDSPFYFLERISEGIGTFFTFGDLKKAERYAALAAERVAEAQAVVEKGKPEAAQIALKRYEDQLNKSLAQAEKAKAKGLKVEKITQALAEATGQHLTVLEGVLEKVPENVKEKITKAKEVSAAGQKNALRALAGENPERATEINLKAAEARLNRAQAKTEEGEIEETEEAVKEFENQYKFGEEISQIAQGLGKDTATVEQLVGKATSVHLEILAKVYEKIPEQAKPAIEKAMEASVKGHEKAVQTLKEKNALEEVPEEISMPENVPKEVKERIEKKVKEEIEKEGVEKPVEKPEVEKPKVEKPETEKPKIEKSQDQPAINIKDSFKGGVSKPEIIEQKSDSRAEQELEQAKLEKEKAQAEEKAKQEAEKAKVEAQRLAEEQRQSEAETLKKEIDNQIMTFSETGEPICKRGDKPIVLMFSTSWCSHCQWVKPAFETVAKEYEGQIIAHNWEIDKGDDTLTINQETLVPQEDLTLYKKYNPRGSIPTFVFGCKYFRIGTGYERDKNLEAEKKEFRQIIETLLQ